MVIWTIHPWIQDCTRIATFKTKHFEPTHCGRLPGKYVFIYGTYTNPEVQRPGRPSGVYGDISLILQRLANHLRAPMDSFDVQIEGVSQCDSLLTFLEAWDGANPDPTCPLQVYFTA